MATVKMSEIVSAYRDKNKYTSYTSMTGRLELVAAVRGIAYDFYHEVSMELMNNEYCACAFILKKLREYKWNGIDFDSDYKPYLNMGSTTNCI